MTNQGKKEQFAASGYNADYYCVDDRDNTIGMPCSTPCVDITAGASSCMQSCSFPILGVATNYISQDTSCQDVYDHAPVARCHMNCLYGGFPSSYTCSSPEGNDINVKGTSTNAYGFNVEDQCLFGQLWEFSCSSNNIVVEKVTCPNGCSNGACTILDCIIPGDTLPICNGIDRTELGNLAQQWMDNPTSQLRTDLGTAAQNWMDNGGP